MGVAEANRTASRKQGAVHHRGGAAVKGATVTARNLATNVSRSATANDEGLYQILGLPPGKYEVTAKASGFSKAQVPSVTLTVGQRGELDIPMAIGDVNATVNISTADVALVETTSTAVANTIDQNRIANLPINERSATGFALTLSTLARGTRRALRLPH